MAYVKTGPLDPFKDHTDMKSQGALEIGFVCMLFILVHALVFHLNSNMWKLVHLADNPALSTIKYHQIIIDNDKIIVLQFLKTSTK